ncbi:ABC transporter substrate-binding protein, partial [Paenibacillus sepulcri]|nr:ABC transporter substrate-binding protein [Paenibacillus sepulcri]
DVQDAKNWFQMWADMRKSGGIVPPEIQAAASTTPEQSMLIKREVAMQLIPSNQLGAYRNATEDELVMHIYPYDNGKNGIALRPSQFMAGYAKTEHPKEVAMFLDFMVNDPEATAILGNDRGAPVNSDVRENLIKSANETDQAIFSYIDEVSKTSDAPYRPNPPGFNENQALYQKLSEKVAFGQETVDKAAEEYYAELQKIIDKMNAAS